MPLPRFTRLPPAEQRRILDASCRMFAEDGIDSASYNQIIAAAGISKSSAYNYFDGREDLLNTVLDDVAERLSRVLGTWQQAADESTFWAEIAETGSRLDRYLAANPHDLALIDPAFLQRAHSAFAVWISALVDNGIGIGQITVDCDRDLLISATAAVLRAGDAWGAAQLQAGRTPDVELPWMLVRNLWGTGDVNEIGERSTG